MLLLSGGWPYNPSQLAVEEPLRAAVIDEDGEVADVQPIPLDLTMKFDPEEELFASYESTLKIRKRPHDLVFSIYDRASGKILLSRVRFEPGTT